MMSEDHFVRDRIASFAEVEMLINTARDILHSENYYLEIQRNRRGEDPLDAFSTKNTLLALGFDVDDIAAEIRSLRLSDYVKTTVDLKRPDSPEFWVFEKTIQNRSVYIKFKIRHVKNKKIFCMSFHFPKWPITKKPYA
ncbi:type II toxin-antitoxin system MqsR family toxin [Sutcliffiella horikoshii]|uniref:Type II toxin-antitoxin system MqsR family toxin n=1 Tax=Sutcliffiella horikoshii TaxID=79883 RepID=A0A5D4T0N9_9BACI|nr:type II toxin-antitoxin system MqsR family toxin [Sutcliffiella horikoshii]TYS67666.1 type II toxin-antitoxin system MqsR family toxin [Sutcliffiella horikoshii]